MRFSNNTYCNHLKYTTWDAGRTTARGFHAAPTPTTQSCMKSACRRHAAPNPWYNAPHGPLAQLAEQGTFNPKAQGSNP